MAALIFAPRVGGDLRAIGDWIAQDNPNRAITFVQEIVAKCQRLTSFPLSYPAFPQLGPAARRCNHGAYAILFEVTEDFVNVLAIVHGARDLDSFTL